MPDGDVLGTHDRWARPSALHLELGVSVSSRIDTEASEECYDILGEDRLDFDRLLILREIAILPQLRGHGIGAWASARSVGLLARDAGTLIATMAAPLHRSEFHSGPDTDEHRDLTSAEQQAWGTAQEKIARHWQSVIGLTPLPRHPHVLVGTVATAREAIEKSLGAWAEGD